MNRCTYDDFLAANGAQSKVLNELTESLAVPRRARLRVAQCTFETVRGGSARELARWSCNAKLTRGRTVALASCAEGAIACPGRKL